MDWNDLTDCGARDAFTASVVIDTRIAFSPRMPRYRGRHKMRTRRLWVARVMREIVWERI